MRRERRKSVHHVTSGLRHGINDHLAEINSGFPLDWNGSTVML